jgi:transposase
MTFCDLAQSRVVFVAENPSSRTFRKFRLFLGDKGIALMQITDLYTDMWESHQMGAAKEYPDAAITFDRYHLMTLLNRAIDQVRHTKVRTLPLLRNDRWMWLKSSWELSPRQLANLERLALLDSKTGEAH